VQHSPNRLNNLTRSGYSYADEVFDDVLEYEIKEKCKARYGIRACHDLPSLSSESVLSISSDLSE